MRGPWGKPNTETGPGKARWLAKGNPEEMPHIRDSNYHRNATLSLSPPVCLSTRTPFPPNKHFTCFTTFHFFVEIHFLQSRTGQGLVMGHEWLGLSALPAAAWLQSLAGTRSPASSRCTARPPENKATRPALAPLPPLPSQLQAPCAQSGEVLPPGLERSCAYTL